MAPDGLPAVATSLAKPSIHPEPRETQPLPHARRQAPLPQRPLRHTRHHPLHRLHGPRGRREPSPSGAPPSPPVRPTSRPLTNTALTSPDGHPPSTERTVSPSSRSRTAMARASTALRSLFRTARPMAEISSSASGPPCLRTDSPSISSAIIGALTAPLPPGAELFLVKKRASGPTFYSPSSLGFHCEKPFPAIAPSGVCDLS